ncbi:MAG: bifunctional phosphoribosylaminoimidazolecarboxamide formyltransferase/IMP cyclohydrolase [Dehalococcoidia bacterium]|nr:bifunctional phosphoribosylaminoimidazolecarboxamide formyltransferase/IMP cyclohydrolase [Dehalococcoidia bacterium]
MKAVLSVYDKTGLVELARKLHAAGVALVSTGGTHRSLSQEGGISVQQVSDLTGFPEILDGRVKTLHPAIHGGLLARRDDPGHMEEMARQGLETIDLVVVNLYPFVETVSKPGVTLEDALENIDIGGPTLLRAAAKNFPFVTVVVDPSDYGWVAEGIAGAGLSQEERRGLARKAFEHVSRYDTAVARYLSEDGRKETPDGPPEELVLSYRRRRQLRYGENPHQAGALYVPAEGNGGIAHAEQLHGRELSFNNLMDADAAWRAVRDYTDTAVAIIKHANACGLACHCDQAEAYRRAYSGDTVSAFGGIVGFNGTVTEETARQMSGVFYEVVVAPDYEPAALEVLKKKRNLRVLAVPPSPGDDGRFDLRPVTGGLLVQSPDVLSEDASAWRCVTARKPSPEHLADLSFAWTAVKHIRSNAIVVAKDRTLLGMGAGQPNRVTSVRLALDLAGDAARGGVLASDAFFPFPDNVEMAAASGIATIAQPGGSIRDEEVIKAADDAGIAMVFTGVRHFKH